MDCISLQSHSDVTLQYQVCHLLMYYCIKYGTCCAFLEKIYPATVEPPIMDPPMSGQPLYKGRCGTN